MQRTNAANKRRLHSHARVTVQWKILSTRFFSCLRTGICRFISLDSLPNTFCREYTSFTENLTRKTTTTMDSLSSAVSAALHDLGYLNRFMIHLVEDEADRSRLCEKVLQGNMHIGSVRDLLCDYSRRQIIVKAQCQMERERTTLSRALSAQTSSSEGPQQDNAEQGPRGKTTVEDIFAAEQRPMPTCEQAQLRIRHDRSDENIVDARLPISVPFKIQYHLAYTVHRTMEAACFTVAKKHLPELLRERNWDCPEAASFSTWVDALNSYPDSAACSALCLTDSYIQSVMALHHTAGGERIPLPLESLLRGAYDAINIMQSLDFKTYETVVAHVPDFPMAFLDLSGYVGAFKTIADAQLARLDNARAGIAAKRAALDAEEAAALQNAKDVITEYGAKWSAEFEAGLPEP